MRKRELLELLRQEEFLTLDQLALHLAVSTRTIRQDIKELNQESSSFTIMKSKNRGYYLQVTNCEEFKQVVQKFEAERFEEKATRLDAIIVYLLLHDCFTTNQQLSEIFAVSVGQIKKDSTAIASRLEEWKLYLERKAHYGLKIVGNLYDKLRLLESYYQQQQKYLQKFLRELISTEERSEVEEVVWNICIAYQLREDGNAASLIQRWIELLMVYHRLNEVHYTDIEISDMQKLKAILARFKVTTDCLPHAHFIYQLLLEYQSNTLLPQNNLKTFLYTLFESVDQQFHTRFVTDLDFMRMIQVHIAMMLESRRLIKTSDSQLVQSLEREFPAIINAALFVVKQIEEHYPPLTIPQEEIGYLASHMAVSYERQNEQKNRRYYRIALVCSSGGGVAQLMEMRIAKIFSHSLIKKFALHQHLEVQRFQPDLVFSIKPLGFEVNCPVIQIKEVLGELDYFSIQNSLDVLTELGTVKDTHQRIIEMIRPELFRTGEYDSYQDLLKEVSLEVEQQVSWPEYSFSILEREGYVSTVYDNGVAIPHPMEMHSNKNVISVTLLPKPICYQQKKVRVVFMLAFQPGQVELHQYLSKKLYGLMQHRSLIKELAMSQNYQEFIKLLKTYL